VSRRLDTIADRTKGPGPGASPRRCATPPDFIVWRADQAGNQNKAPTYGGWMVTAYPAGPLSETRGTSSGTIAAFRPGAMTRNGFKAIDQGGAG
jgi:hypothetical protein